MHSSDLWPILRMLDPQSHALGCAALKLYPEAKFSTQRALQNQAKRLGHYTHAGFETNCERQSPRVKPPCRGIKQSTQQRAVEPRRVRRAWGVLATCGASDKKRAITLQIQPLGYTKRSKTSHRKPQRTCFLRSSAATRTSAQASASRSCASTSRKDRLRECTQRELSAHNRRILISHSSKIR
jgi:hypothetical protein